MPPPNYTVEVLLKAEDNLSKALAYARSQLQSFGEAGVREAGRLESSFESLSTAVSRLFKLAVIEAGDYLRSFLSSSMDAFAGLRLRRSGLPLSQPTRARVFRDLHRPSV
jgi:hypothetical protein